MDVRLSMMSQNNLDDSLISLNPNVNSALPNPPLTYVLKCHVFILVYKVLAVFTYYTLNTTRDRDSIASLF